MIEPEMAFCDLEGLMDIEEEMLKYVINYVLENASAEIDSRDQFVEKRLKENLLNIVNAKFVRISHHDVVGLLLNSG
jgi:asparaginyl-tRNA synthetase